MSETRMTNGTEQTAPDTEGEWRVEAMPTHGWWVVDATGQEIVADVYRKEDAARMVADHEAVKNQTTLVEAINEAITLLEDHVDNALDATITLRAALEAAGVAE